MNEQEANEIIRESERQAIDVACKALRGHVRLTQECIAKLVASMCNVGVEQMLTEKYREPYVLARCLYWYAIKQIWGFTNAYISKESEKRRKFKLASVTQSTSRMSMLIQKEPIWRKRWAILKRIIDEINKLD